MSTVKHIPPFFYSPDIYEAKLGKHKNQIITDARILYMDVLDVVSI